jgi:hypothetical protein
MGGSQGLSLRDLGLPPQADNVGDPAVEYSDLCCPVVRERTKLEIGETLLIG